MKRKTRFGEQLHELRGMLNSLSGAVGSIVRRMESRGATTKQERFNAEMLEIVSNLATDVRRIREGKTLSNLAGVEKQIARLESEMQFK